MKPALIAAAAASVLLAGCSNLSGVGGGSSYSCKAPEGVACDSVSGTYANAAQNNLPSQRAKAAAFPSSSASSTTAPKPRPATDAASNTGSSDSSISTSLPPSPVALRSAPRVLRMWFKPWEDADHDLYDQGYVYVQVDGGQWQIEHVQRRIREAYAPLKAPPRAPANADRPGGTNSTASLPRPAATPLLPNQSRTPDSGSRALEQRAPAAAEEPDE